MEIHYQIDKKGRLLTLCPNGKECLVGGGDCIECEFYKYKNMSKKTISCKFRRKGTKNG